MSIKRNSKKDQQIAILGYGKEGKAVRRFLRKNHPEATIEILDQKQGSGYLKKLDRFDTIYRSPGVPYLTSEIQAARKKGVVISSSTKLFLEHAPGTVIGITGTKGKGTTSTLLYKMLKAAGKDVYLAGNVGTPAISVLPKLKKDSFIILELSSFQLQDCERSPKIAVMLEIFPDHMDSHRTYAEYVRAKGNVTLHQKKNDTLFYHPKNKEAHRAATKSRARKMSIALDDNEATLTKIKGVIAIPGDHNLKNALAAALVAKHLGIPDKTILSTIKKYRGIPYRLQYITSVKGVRIYNDSGSTNPMTTVAAVRAFKNPSFILAGGKDKNLDYAPLTKALTENSTVRRVFLFGENREKIAKAVPAHIRTIRTVTMETAFGKALEEAHPGDVIILSPGAASFDQFPNYKERGKTFTRIAKEAKTKYTS